MGLTKRWLEEVSCEMGLDGEITRAVMLEGERRLAQRRGITALIHKDEDVDAGQVVGPLYCVTHEGTEPYQLDADGNCCWVSAHHASLIAEVLGVPLNQE
jgi:hypothetical protein